MASGGRSLRVSGPDLTSVWLLGMAGIQDAAPANSLPAQR